jgi:hypothetical protein
LIKPFINLESKIFIPSSPLLFFVSPTDVS